MERARKSSKPKVKRIPLTVAHRGRLLEELRADPELAAEYLNAAADEDDPRIYLSALRAVAEAQGMAKVARAAGVPRESLYRALSAGGNPRFDTLQAILRAAGFKLAVQRIPGRVSLTTPPPAARRFIGSDKREGDVARHSKRLLREHFRGK